jgi:PAS domain S-box-containing protein
MIFTDLVNNIALLLSLSIFYSFLTRSGNSTSVSGRVLTGCIFGLVTVAGMMNPFHFSEGIIFDGRSIVLSMAGLFGGPVTAAVSAFIAGCWRLHLGGIAAWPGCATIITSAALGTAYYYLRKRKPELFSPFYVFIFGVFVHICVLLWMLTLPKPLSFDVLRKVSLPMMLLCPAATLLMAQLLNGLESRNVMLKMLKDSEEKYRRIVETSNEGIWTMDKNFYTVYLNPVMAEMLGYKTEEMTGRPVTDFMFPEDLNHHNEKMEKYQKGMDGKYERRFRRKDGTELWTIVSATALFDKEKGFQGSFAMFTDITERRRTEEELRRQKELLQTIMDNIPIMVSFFSADGRYRWMNRCWEKTLGWSVEEARARDLLKEFYPDPDYCRYVTDFIQSVQEVWGDFKTCRRDGKILDTSWINVSLSDGSHIGIGIDRTAEKHAEKSLYESEERFRIAFENAAVGITLVNTEGKYLKANRKYAEILGYDREELERMNVHETSHHEDANISADFIRSAIAGETDSGIFEKRHLHKKGHIVWTQISSTVFRDSQGNPLYFISHILDITEMKKLEAERLKLEARIRQAQKMEALGTLAGGIAHDFNNILTPLIGYTEMLMMNGFSQHEDAHEKLKRILQASVRAKELVRRILTFSRGAENTYTPIKIQPLIQECLELLRCSIPKSVEFVQQIDPECEAVMGDPTQIQQIVLNLCTNACHAMEEKGGLLAVRLEQIEIGHNDSLKKLILKPGRHLRLTVSDTGHGIAPAHIEKIFDPYFTTKPVGKGTGLGLSVVHGIVKGLGGEIAVYSEIGKGTAFHIYLPVIETGYKKLIPQRRDMPQGNESILLADDEIQIVPMLKMMLEKLGYRVTGLTDSTEALAVFQEKPEAFDLVITDMNMPRMTGDVFARKIKALRSDIPVILCTGFSEQMNGHGLKESGIQAFLMKPLSMAELAETVRRVLDEAGKKISHE